jgi:site-specific DNA-methyltransferase (cytosine-N4-specific)
VYKPGIPGLLEKPVRTMIPVTLSGGYKHPSGGSNLERPATTTDMSRSGSLFPDVAAGGPVDEPRPRSDGVTGRVIHADAFDVLAALPEESVDLLITSPPYWGLRTYGMGHNWDILDEWRAEGHEDEDVPTYEWYRAHGGLLGMEPLPDWFTAHLADIIDRVKKPLKPGGSLWINIGDTFFARWSSIRENGRQGMGGHGRERRKTPMGGYRQEKQLLLIPARFAIEMQKRRWIVRNDLIWHKPNVPPRQEKDRLRLAHEHFFHFVKRPKEGRPAYYYDLTHVEPANNDVVTYTVKSGEEGHSATFPTDLIRPRILSTCPPGGLVLDPFAGTGRSLAVAIESGRSGLGIEKSEKFIDVARRTIDAALRKA